MIERCYQYQQDKLFVQSIHKFCQMQELFAFIKRFIFPNLLYQKQILNSTLTYQQEQENMGNICSCLCPKRQNNKNANYDVHEETFQMQQNLDSMNIDDLSPQQSKDMSMQDQITQESKSSNEVLITKKKQFQAQRSNKMQQQKYIQTKIKSNGYQGKLNSQSLQSNMDEQLGSSKDIHQQTPLISAIQQQLIISQNPLTNQVKPSPPIQKPKQQQKKTNPNILKPKKIKKNYNPDDYQFKGQNDSFKVKKIDSIKCQQYNIDNCNNSEYFIFDVTANVYIDDTNSCKIFIAPCESTIFVRNCKNLVIVAATKQFRTYQCHNCVFSLVCKSQPVIQSSSNLTFVPFQMPYYRQFRQQLNTIKLDLWNNHWSQIHNFTKKQGQVHYSLKRNLSQQQNLNWQKGFLEAQIQKVQQNPVPFIHGQYSQLAQNKLIVLFNKDTSQNDDIILQYTKQYIILKGFKGKISGFGKDQRVALLLGYQRQVENEQKLKQAGQLFIDKEQVQKYEQQFFVNFGDQRQK